MKRKILTLFLILVSTLCLCFGLTSCDDFTWSTPESGDETTNNSGDTTDSSDNTTDNNGDTTDNSGNTTQKIEVPEGTKNAVVLNYTDNKDGTLTITVSIEGDVCFAGFTGVLEYDVAVLTYSSSQAINQNVLLNPNTGKIYFSFASATDITTATNMFSATFTYSGSVNTTVGVSILEGDFSDATFNNVDYTILGGNIVIE